MKTHRSTVLIGMVFLSICTLQAQSIERQVVSSSGDIATTPDYQISWTIGETAVQTATAENKILTEGFQQPDIRIERIDMPEQVVDQGNQNIEVYPNPASHSITIDPGSGTDGYSADLFSLEGKILTSRQCSGKAQMDISALPQGMYILRILSGDNSSESSFRISKM